MKNARLVLAAAALPALIQNDGAVGMVDVETVASQAVTIADAVLKVLEK